MSHLPITPLSPEEHQRIMGQIYPLLEKQVRSYHKHRHMGNNSSVPVELAQELMESIEYTIGLVGGVYAHRNIEERTILGDLWVRGKYKNYTIADHQREKRYHSGRTGQKSQGRKIDCMAN